MTATVVQSATGLNTDVFCTATLPTPATAGNILWISMTSNRNIDNILIPTGFTLISSVSDTAGNLKTAFKVAAGGETAITFNAGANSRLLSTLVEVSGGDSTAITQSSSSTGAAATTWNSPSVNASGLFLSALSLGTTTGNPETWVGGWGGGFSNISAFDCSTNTNNVAQSVGQLHVSPAAATSTSRSWTTSVFGVGALNVIPDADAGGVVGEGSASGAVDFTGTASNTPPGVAPEFGGIGSAVQGADSNIILPAPTGLQTGNYQLAIIAIASDTEPILTVPSGWTGVGVLTNPRSGGAATSRLEIYASTTDTGTATFSRGTVSGDHEYHAVRVYWTGQASVAGATVQNAVGQVTDIPIPSQTTTVNNSMVIGVVNQECPPADGPPSYTVPAGWTERYNASLTVENEGIAVADFVQATAGTVDGTFVSTVDDYAIAFSVVLVATTVSNPQGSITGSYAFDGAGSTGEQPPGAGASTGATDWAGFTAGAKHPAGSVSPKVYAYDTQTTGKRVPKGSKSGGVDFSRGAASGVQPGISSGFGSYDYTHVTAGTTERDGSAAGTDDFTGAAQGSHQSGTVAGAYDFSSTPVGVTPVVANDGVASGGYNYDDLPGAGEAALFGTITQAFDFTGTPVGQQPTVLPHQGSVPAAFIYNHGNILGEREPKAATAGEYTYAPVVLGKGTSIVYEFTPPTYELIVPNRRPAYKLTWSLSVVRINGVLTEWNTPGGRMLDEAGDEGVDWFIGGHIYHVPKDVADELEAAGFTVTRV